ncbi:MAG: GAF domain-containing protein [Anaerolineae bacterium]
MQENMLTSFFQLTPLPHVILNNVGKIMMANTASEALLGESFDSLKHQPLDDYIHEAHHAQYRAWIGKEDTVLPILVIPLNRSQQGELQVQLQGRKTNDRTIISLTQLSKRPILDPESLLHPLQQLDSDLDIAEIRNVVVSNALYDSILAITGTLELDEVLDQILENISRVIPHDAADIMLIRDDVASIVRSRGYHEHQLEDVIKTLRFPVDSTPTLAHMIRTQSPIIMDDLQYNSDWVERPRQTWMRAYAGVPIRIAENVIGFLNLVSQQSAYFKEAHLKWLKIFATQAAVAINNARAHEKSNELAVAEERQRMAGEIHDTVSQMLFSASMIAESLTTDELINDVAILEQLTHISRLNRGALSEMRLLLMEYKPENLVRMELPQLLERLKQAVEGRLPIEIKLKINDGHPAPSDVRLVFYRIAQEALNNVSKHSHTTQAQLQFISTELYVKMEIIDQGVGFDSNTIHRGFGLENMRKRAASIDASLTIESHEGEGTAIRVHWLRDKIRQIRYLDSD